LANPVSSVDVPLSLYSSLDTELSAPDCPEGISPDNSDVIYLPGSVSTRPGYQRVFVSALRASGTVTYEKSFVPPNKQIKNLYFTNDGTLWVEDLLNTPGTATVLFTGSGTTASSVTAFGREYIAFSDGVHGTDAPIQYDGTSPTGNIWRVTQDGPGVPPVVVSIALPSSQMAQVSTPGGTVIVSITPSGATQIWEGPDIGYVTYYTTVIVITATSFAPSGNFSISGNSRSDFNTSFLPISQTSPTVILCGNPGTPTNAVAGTGGTTGSTSSLTLSRFNNTVSCSTTTAHGLRVGYQAQISGIPAEAIGGGISTIVLNNENLSGIATVTTVAAHGLLPNNIINIAGVSGKTVGTAISNIAAVGDIVTVTTSAAHGLQIDSEVIIAAVTATWANGQWTVTSVPSATTFTYVLVSNLLATSPYNASDSGTVSYIWPLANVNPEQNYFTVQTCPTATSFTIPLSYTDGTWTGGTISFAWNGTFYVTAVPSATSFQYQQYGPNGTSGTVGTVTPYGQASPGLHQCEMSFLLASGAITAPSPPVTFVANGGQYLSISQMVTGPSGIVVGRILQFTGAGGAYFFYIPTPAQVNGLVVSTATQINDNSTTSVILDFADATLYAATGCSIPGNNLANQVVLGPCAGFFTYASRLQAWGEYNKVQNFLNMGFNGGNSIVSSGVPPGWVSTINTIGTPSLAAGRLGSAWQINVGSTGTRWGEIAQGAYADSSGAPIILPNTAYQAKFWAATNGVAFAADSIVFFILSSAASGFFSSAAVPLADLSQTGGWFSAPFSVPTGNNIPPDLLLQVSVYGSSTGALTVTLDELELIYTAQPYLDQQERLSYAENPEGFDGITGVLGPQDDNTPIMNHGTIRQTLYIVTGGSLHSTQDNGSTEPSGWDVDHVADNCGGWSIASVARNTQGIGSAGKEWMTWSGPDGAQVFDGRQPEKVSQEIQSLWDAIDQSLTSQCWSKNDQTNKRCYYGVPLSPTETQVLVLDYRNLAGDAIGSTPPVHISFTGKMIASDLTRKWTQWNGGNFYCGELMYRPGFAQPQMCFGGVNPNGGANVYMLNAAKYQDDDFGLIPAYYTTYFFVSHEMEQALQVGSHRHIYTLAQAFIAGVGTWSLTPYATALTNPQPASSQYPFSLTPGQDRDFGINVTTTRCAFRIAAQPLEGSLDSYFKLQKLVINMAKDPNAQVGGAPVGLY
jgi:hypothetical protein